MVAWVVNSCCTCLSFNSGVGCSILGVTIPPSFVFALVCACVLLDVHSKHASIIGSSFHVLSLSMLEQGFKFLNRLVCVPSRMTIKGSGNILSLFVPSAVCAPLRFVVGGRCLPHKLLSCLAGLLQKRL